MPNFQEMSDLVPSKEKKDSKEKDKPKEKDEAKAEIKVNLAKKEQKDEKEKEKHKEKEQARVGIVMREKKELKETEKKEKEEAKTGATKKEKTSWGEPKENEKPKAQEKEKPKELDNEKLKEEKQKIKEKEEKQKQREKQRALKQDSKTGIAIKEIKNESDLESKLKAAGESLVIVDFYATWCMPCKMISSQVVHMAGEYKDVTFYKVNVDENEALSLKYDVATLPTFLLFKQGKVVETVIGSNIDKVETSLKKHKS